MNRFNAIPPYNPEDHKRAVKHGSLSINNIIIIILLDSGRTIIITIIYFLILIR